MAKRAEYTSLNTWGPFHKYGLTLILAWMCIHMPSTVSDEIAY